MVERFNRTLKTKMLRVFTRRGTYKWLDILPDLIYSYNHTRHSGIGKSPDSVTKDNQAELQRKQYLKTPDHIKYKLKVGDHVRISKVKGIFAKGYEPNWSEEVFTIVARNKTTPPMYKLQDYQGEEIRGSFYEPELQVVPKPEKYRVEKVVRTRTRKDGSKQYLVRWLGYPESADSWVNALEKGV